MMDGIRKPTRGEVKRDAQLVMCLCKLARRQGQQFRFQRDARTIVSDRLVKFLYKPPPKSVSARRGAKKKGGGTGSTCFERDVTQHDERVRRFELHFNVPVHLLLVYRAREIEHLPRSIKVVFGLRLVRALASFFSLALNIQLRRLREQINSGIMVMIITIFFFFFCVTGERQDLVAIWCWFCMRKKRGISSSHRSND